MLDKLTRRLYFDMPLSGNYDAAKPYREFDQFATLGQLGRGLTRMVIDSAASIICQRLKCVVQPVGADYKLERECRDLSAVIYGVMDAVKYWDLLAPVAVRDGLNSSLGTILWYVEDGEILGRNVSADCVRWHWGEGMNPIHFYVEEAYPRHGLINRFPKKRNEIMNLARWSKPSVVGVDFPGSNGDDTVRVVQAWRRRMGDTNGKWAIMAGNDLVLDVQPWAYDFFPTAHYRYDWDSRGFGGYAGARVVAPYHQASNKLLRMAYEGFSGAVPTVLMNSAERGLDEFEASTTSWRKQFWTNQKPEIFIPQAVSEQVLQELGKLKDEAFFAFGMNQSAAAGTRPDGLNSAPSQREWKDMRNERLSKQIYNYSAMANDAARVITALASEAYKGRKVRVQAPGTSALEMIKWPVNLKEDKYQITFTESSGLSSTLAGRKEELSDLRDRGSITEATYLKELAIPNIKSLTDRVSAPGDLAAQQISKALDECILEIPDAIQGPGLEIVVSVGAQEYQRAKISGKYPAKNLECLRRLIQNADARVKGLTAKKPVMPVPAVLPGQPGAVAPMPSSVLPAALPPEPVVPMDGLPTPI
jgi:hypothetical protein